MKLKWTVLLLLFYSCPFLGLSFDHSFLMSLHLWSPIRPFWCSMDCPLISLLSLFILCPIIYFVFCPILYNFCRPFFYCRSVSFLCPGLFISIDKSYPVLIIPPPPTRSELAKTLLILILMSSTLYVADIWVLADPSFYN